MVKEWAELGIKNWFAISTSDREASIKKGWNACVYQTREWIFFFLLEPGCLSMGGGVEDRVKWKLLMLGDGSWESIM